MRILIFLAFIGVFLIHTGCNQRTGKPRLLVFSKTAGFRHSSIDAGKKAIESIAQKEGYMVDTTEDPGYFTEDSLKNYAAVIFLQATGDLLNQYQEADFERYIQAGGSFVGIHAAADAEYDWSWYGKLVGGYFESHPAQQDAVLQITDNKHISTAHLPQSWKRWDEWYNFKKLNPSTHVLMKIDESSYQGGKNGVDHPMAWYHEYDGGRAWYTALGHTDASYTDTLFLQHLKGGIQYAIGKFNKLNYSNATTLRVPEEDRFTKEQLVQGTFYEPTEMTILPNKDVLIVQRRGEFMLYKESDKSIRQVGFLPVYFKTKKGGVNAEEGLLGVQADPDFSRNHFIYAFYSPYDTSVNRLSRFKFENDSLVTSSEKIILEFYSQREICCHTGGSIAFGNDRQLFVSTGDNTTPFDQPTTFANHGFAPIDGRPGFEQYDARRSSGNTNDLRGKILRITVNEDGSYSIPQGNLFPNGMAKSRPEIYVMGNRNPYRIAYDKKRGYLYWGEVGPDAGNDSLETRGPRGYDELNQAKKAGFFGWPLFVGNNYPYYSYNYSTGQKGDRFDALKPINNSPNNTGLSELPPVSPAFIWYPYAVSSDFPQMGTGGRNAMAGPTYYTKDYPKATRLPDYYDGKVFIYEWMRNFIRVVTLDQNGDFSKMEPFMPSTRLSALIDMEVAADGTVYLLEYGSGWFSKNADAGLSRIQFNPGNRNPVITEQLEIDKVSGKLPFAIKAKLSARDPEKADLIYKWDLGNGMKKETTEPILDHIYDKAGEYTISVMVTDKEGASVKSNSVSVYAGNETPIVYIQIKGNKTFYFEGIPVEYEVKVSDADAGILQDKTIVTAAYQEGSDKSSSDQGHKVLTTAMIGKNLMSSLDCKNCHKVEEKSIGPSFNEVAERYKNDPKSSDYLINKIVNGGGGVWGEVAMAAHPDLKKEDAGTIVTWIQSLAAEESKKRYAFKGTLAPTLGQKEKENGVLVISGTYTDEGGPGIRPMTGLGEYTLRNSKLYFENASDLSSFTAMNYNGKRLMIVPSQKGWFAVGPVDLTGIKKVELGAGWQKAPEKGYAVEIRLDRADGILLGKGMIAGATSNAGTPMSSTFAIQVQQVSDGQLHRLYIVTSPITKEEKNPVAIQFIKFVTKG